MENTPIWSGLDYDPEKFASVFSEPEEKDKAETRIITYVTYCSRTEHQLRTRLQKYGYEETQIEESIRWAVHLGLINDYEYACRYYDECVSHRRKAGNWIRQSLRTKGVPTEIISKVMEEKEVFQDVSEVNIINAKVTAQKIKRQAPAEKWRQRAVNTLLRDGYSYSTIKIVIDELMSDEELPPEDF